MTNKAPTNVIFYTTGKDGDKSISFIINWSQIMDKTTL